MRTLVAAGETPGGECGDCQVDSARGGDAVAWVLDEGVDECEVESSLKKVPTLPYLDRWTHCLTSVELAARKTGKKEKQKRKGVMISSPSTSYRHRRRLLHEKAIHVRSRPSSTLDQSSTCIIHQIRSSTYLGTYIPYTSHRNHTIPTYMYLPTQKPPIQIPYKSKLLSSKHNDDTPPPPPPPANPSKRIPIPPFSTPSPNGVKMVLLL